jgi:hypothetical protein
MDDFSLSFSVNGISILSQFKRYLQVCRSDEKVAKSVHYGEPKIVGKIMERPPAKVAF